MLRTFDIVLIVVMTAAATVTYTIKHRAENKLEEVRKLDVAIKLEEDTIDLLRADWALLTQPNRLERLVGAFGADLQLVPTLDTARPAAGTADAEGRSARARGQVGQGWHRRHHRKDR